MMSLTSVETPNAPRPVGPYSQAVWCGPFLFLSGQIAIDPTTGSLRRGSIENEAEQVFKNIHAILVSQGISFSQCVKTTIFIRNMSDFQEVNRIYEKYFKPPYPARSTVEVSALPKGALIEIEVMAHTREG